MTLDVGIFLPQVALTHHQIIERAQRVEQLGLTSFWIYDHLYSPGLPDHDSLEGWTLATTLLARTERLRVGHLVLDNNLRHPAVLAQMVATLDVVSDGRLEVGLGSGSYALEHEQAGIGFGTMAERTGRLAEALAVVDGLLTTAGFVFDGEHYAVHDLPCRPAPVQQPRPPFHIGGIGERYTLPLVARFADVWNIPTYGLVGWTEKAVALDRLCEQIGRDPATIRRSHQAVLVLAADEASLAVALERAGRRYAGPGWNLEAGGYVGTPAQLVDHIAAQRAAGIDDFIFLPADRGEGDTLDLLAEVVLPDLT